MHVATNLSIDPKLLDRALAVSGERTKKAAVTRALEEFIARRRQKQIVALFGTLESGPSATTARANASAHEAVRRHQRLVARAAPRRTDIHARGEGAAAGSGGGECRALHGLVLQELLQGFHGPRARDLILEAFSALPFLVLDRSDHVEAAELRNACRRKEGSQAGAIDALLAHLCLHHGLTLMTADSDFARMASVCPLVLWGA